MASTLGLSDRAAISTTVSVGTTIHGGSIGDRRQTKSTPALAFFSNPEEGPTVVDTSSLAITAIVKGKEIAGTIIDGGSGVNVISLQTCDNLGIREWEPCPFWLRMADTSLS